MLATINKSTLDELTFTTEKGANPNAEMYKILTFSREAAKNKLEASMSALNKIELFNTLLDSSALTGGYVQFRQELGCLPALIGNDSRPVFLYEFIEVIDGLVDYHRVMEEFPTLSYAQINGAISFIRKLAQVNAKDIDIDALEDEIDANDVELTDALRDGLINGENLRVLNNG